MARPRKPTEILIASGAARKHPDRMRERAAEPVSGGDLRTLPPPPHVDAALWSELAAGLPVRAAGTADTIAFEALVRLTDRMRQGDANSGELERLRALLGAFGMTPASRPTGKPTHDKPQHLGA